MNTKIFRAAVLTILTLTLITFANPAAGRPTCDPIGIAQKTACVQAQVAPFGGGAYNTWTEVSDVGNGTMAVVFYFEPTCLNDPVPCRLATQCVMATVDCKTRTAACAY